MAKYMEVDLGEVSSATSSRAWLAETSPRSRDELGGKVQALIPREWRSRIRELASEYGIKESNVIRALLGQGLAAAVPEMHDTIKEYAMPTVKVNREELATLLPTYTDRELAARYNVTPARIRQLRLQFLGTPAGTGPRRRSSKYGGVTNTPEFIQAVGQMTDAAVAAKFSVPSNVVTAARKKLGSGSFAAARRKDILPKLGTAPDGVLAQEYGYSLSGVVALRRRYNVPPYKAPAAEGGEATEAKPRRTRRPQKEVTPAKIDGDLEFLMRRHKAGDSPEALAARLEIPEAKVRQMLGLE